MLAAAGGAEEGPSTPVTERPCSEGRCVGCFASEDVIGQLCGLLPGRAALADFQMSEQPWGRDKPRLVVAFTCFCVSLDPVCSSV